MSSYSGVRADRPSTDVADAVAGEQEYVSMLYGRLDSMREQAGKRLATTLRSGGDTPQALAERDSAIAMYTDQIAQYSGVENGLCFGRLDLTDGTRRYIGRIGVFGDSGEHEQLLMDWRAPAARPFYLATAAAPDGVRRRRHIRTRERTVTGVDDEVLDLREARHSGHTGLTGEAALFAAMDAGRTGRMRDIVETIQGEQDRVIRAELPGVLVVQGGPGTGKTAVALHRAAYLLYTHRQELATRGVLLVGPNETFLRYISQVLPTLAETGVLLRTPGDLFPGVRATATEPDEVAEVKGRAVMADVLAEAVRDRQRVPDAPIEVAVEQDTLLLDPEMVARARDRVRRAGRPHNLARPLFDIEIVHALADQVAARLGADPLGGENLLDEADVAEIRRELRGEPEVRAVLDWLWPVLTPQQVLAGLYASADRLDRAAGPLTPAERELLRRKPSYDWTPADVVLLDEAAELLGEDGRVRRAVQERAEAARRRRIEYAEGALEIAKGSRSIDLEDESEESAEVLSITDLLDADQLAERQEQTEWLTTAERAAADRTWAFGHVIVDEAQELSAMAWRVLMRRCPSRSMTLVGDVAQTGAPGGVSSWAEVLEPYVGQRWRLEELTVSYRTPAEILALAAPVLAAIDPTLRPPEAVRHSGAGPWDRLVPADRLADEVARAVLAELDQLDEGLVGVIVPTELRDPVDRAVVAAVPEARGGRVVVSTVGQAKGLEFDSVLLVEPDRIVAGSPRGLSDLYVALTRATRRLGVLRTGGVALTGR